ncbi:MAG: alpha/beta hydrolase [Saprospiraceae bacterium]|nr:alpha/beta hydrolase [Saprospiraceae bacterium]
MSLQHKLHQLLLLLTLVGISACVQEKKAPSPIPPAISADGLPIDYLVQGNGKLSVILVHGWSCDKSYWKQQLDNLSKEYQVVTIDLGGHGSSGLTRENWTMDAFGEDVVAVIQHLNLEKVVLVGHSMGGRVIVEVAQRLPEKVLGLVGVDTWGDFAVQTKEQVEKIIAPFRENFVETTRQMVRGMFLEDADSVYMEGIITDMSSAPPTVAISSGMYYQLWNAQEEFADIQVPLKLIISERGFNPSAIEPYGIEADVMKEVGHFLMMEDPDTFHELLANDIEEIISAENQ